MANVRYLFHRSLPLYGFSEVEAAIAVLHDVPAERRSAFSHRLKHLQRLGFPKGINTGRGKAATYLPEHVFQMAVAVELLQFGFTPDPAARTVTANLDYLALGVVQHDLNRGRERIICGFRAEGLFDRSSQETAIISRLECEPTSRTIAPLGEWFNETEEVNRVALFSLSSLIAKLDKSLPSEPGRFEEQLKAWAVTIIDKKGIPNRSGYRGPDGD